MSIKSQKSLNDECSEIFEKSYSVRSASEDSLSLSEDEDECLARQLMLKLSPPQLSRLRRCFRTNRERTHAQDLDRRVEEVMRVAAAEEGIEFAATAPPPEDSLWLDENSFVAALDKIFGHRKYSVHAHKLFHLIDPFGTGRVWWRQLLAKMVAVGAKQTRSRAEVWEPVTEVCIKRLPHCKRETIVKIECVETTDSFCYVAVSRGGRVGLYSGELTLLHSYEVFYRTSGVRRRVKNRWITDAVYLSDVQCLVLSSSDRSLSIYDASTVTHTLLYCINGLPHIPTCLAYSPSSNASECSELAFGTECGDVTRIRFLQPRVQLLYTSNNDHAHYYYWMELSCPPHNSYCVLSRWRRCHARVVRRVRYSRAGTLLLSAAHDCNAALCVRHVAGKLDDMVLKLQAGVSCFHAVWSLQLVVCGGADGALRVWPAGQRAPAALTPPAPAPILDVAVVPPQGIVLAYCNNCVVHIWDLYEECLLQSIKIKFPLRGALAKKMEFGTYCIHPGPARRAEEPQQQQEEGLQSRRGSSVYQGSTGGLMLQNDDASHGNRRLEEEPEYAAYSRSEVLVSWSSYVCVLRLRPASGAVLQPVSATRTARRPSTWDLPHYTPIESNPVVTRPVPVPPAGPLLLSPCTAYTTDIPTDDLDTLLDNAGLKGILEKDFVLMQGLKNDLNRKLAEIEANKETRERPLCGCAPHLSLQLHAPLAPQPAALHTDRYRRIMRLFPAGSATGTNTNSARSTPRYGTTPRLGNRSFRL